MKLTIGLIVCLSWVNSDKVIGYSSAACYCKSNSAGEIIKIKERKGKTFITVNVLAGSKYQQSTILLNAKDSIQ